MTRDELQAKLLANREIAENGCWLWTRARQPGRFDYGVMAIGDGDTAMTHRVAAHVWKDFDLASPLCVCHHCDNPPCFNPDHLFMGTRGDNLADMTRKGRRRTFVRIGEEHGASVLTEDDVRSIRARREAGESMYALGNAFGVSRAQVRNICLRRHWKHVN